MKLLMVGCHEYFISEINICGCVEKKVVFFCILDTKEKGY